MHQDYAISCYVLKKALAFASSGVNMLVLNWADVASSPKIVADNFMLVSLQSK